MRTQESGVRIGGGLVLSDNMLFTKVRDVKVLKQTPIFVLLWLLGEYDNVKTVNSSGSPRHPGEPPRLP